MAAAPSDPVLAGVLEDIRAVGPRKWRHWIDRRPRAIIREVRDDLERAHLIRVEPHRILGLIPADRITLRHPLRTAPDPAERDATPCDRPAWSPGWTCATPRSSSSRPRRTSAPSSPRSSAPGTRTGWRSSASASVPIVPALKRSLQQSQYSAG